MVRAFRRGQTRAPKTRHPRHPGWPEATPEVRLPDYAIVRLRPLALRDGSAWRAQRISDRQFLEPVEPTVPGGWKSAHSKAAWVGTLLSLRSSADAGVALPLAIELDGRFVGQVTMGNIQHGVVSDCWVGYWVHSSVTGRGVATAALALALDHAFLRVGVHRVTATYLPENLASGKVLERCGFRTEGFLRRNIHINGEWRDHHLVAITDDDFTQSAVKRVRESGRIL
ncbi:GNAT family N-acetyltransferase [Corynebacterium canis]|uniref:GNAT family N-acetyltransferase n=1 Tax=Corynebacterium canis TaxID=679663 RepID=A0A5C5UL50_9CORY|nr:GNAT family protein [Corynebacterium canis]TWT26738.1 GNAT family N-acetyltransferase [Corynebacterium canis]WJY74666.1 Putative ribosomal N-acetyltransferase YdaF [Corynebacterium canis]